MRSDSLLLVQQMLGNYKVKNPGLQPLHAKARLLAHEIGRVTFEHVGRALNAHADRLANAAMDGEAKCGSLKSEQTSEQKPKDLFTAVERAVRLFVYRHLIDTTRTPDVPTIADAVKRSRTR